MLAIKNMKMPKSCSDCKFCYKERNEYGYYEGPDYCWFDNEYRDLYEVSQGKMFDKRQDNCPLVEVEPLTDDEKRLFLSSMNREEGICEAFDNEKVDDGSVKKLLPIVKKIERKVKKALWQ